MVKTALSGVKKIRLKNRLNLISKTAKPDLRQKFKRYENFTIVVIDERSREGGAGNLPN